jgi:ribosome-binding factor A
MPNRRAARVAERIREDVSLFLLRELRDPRLELLTITRAEVSDDLKHATVFFSVLGDDARRRTAERGLASARGIIRSHLAKGLKLREAPDLAFEFDRSIQKAIELSKLIDQVAAERRERHPDEPEPSPEEPTETDSDEI